MPRLKPRDLFLDYHLLYTGMEIDEVVEELTDIVKENLEGRLRDREKFCSKLCPLINIYKYSFCLPVAPFV